MAGLLAVRWHLQLIRNRISTFPPPATVDNCILKHAKPITVLGTLCLWFPLPGIFFSLIFTYRSPSYCSSLKSCHPFWEGFWSHSPSSLLDSLYHLPCLNSLHTVYYFLIFLDFCFSVFAHWNGGFKRVEPVSVLLTAVCPAPRTGWDSKCSISRHLVND